MKCLFLPFSIGTILLFSGCNYTTGLGLAVSTLQAFPGIKKIGKSDDYQGEINLKIPKDTGAVKIEFSESP